MPNRPRAIVLLSGGMDSATCLAIAIRRDLCAVTALSFDYGQRHRAELDAARNIAARMEAEDHRVVAVDLAALGGSALTDRTIAVPEERATTTQGAIPVTYVPARNTVFLAYALALAEVRDADFIYVGVNAIDYSGYPDCRPEYIESFQKMAILATRRGIEGRPLEIRVPLIHLAKPEIVRTGLALGVDFAETVSCYQANEHGEACGRCDACYLRRRGFADAGVVDPTRYCLPHRNGAP